MAWPSQQGNTPTASAVAVASSKAEFPVAMQAALSCRFAFHYSTLKCVLYALHHYAVCCRSNVVTEDLDKIFSKKSSPAGRKAA